MIKMQNWLLIPVLGLLFCVSRMKAKEHMQSLQNKPRFSSFLPAAKQPRIENWGVVMMFWFSRA